MKLGGSGEGAMERENKKKKKGKERNKERRRRQFRIAHGCLARCGDSFILAWHMVATSTNHVMTKVQALAIERQPTC